MRKISAIALHKRLEKKGFVQNLILHAFRGTLFQVFAMRIAANFYGLKLLCVQLQRFLLKSACRLFLAQNKWQKHFKDAR
jgi:hypothetical protein